MRSAVVGLSLMTLAASSCGGAPQPLPGPERAALELPQASAAPMGNRPKRAPASAETRVSEARQPAPADGATQQAPPAETRSREVPPPVDAWADDAIGRAGAEQAFDAHYPAHGIAFHVQAQIFVAPSADAEVLGYMRRGTRFRATAGQRGSGCDTRWHELSHGGFVCRGAGFIIGDEPQSFEPSPAAPLLEDALPYRYAKNAGHDVPQYWRPPSEEEALQARELIALSRETLAASPRPQAAVDGAAQVTGQAAGEQLLTRSSSPGEGDEALATNTIASIDPDAPEVLAGLPDYVRMGMQPGFYVSLDAPTPPRERDGSADSAEQGADAAARALNEAYERTVRGAYVLADKLQPVEIGAAPGVVLREGSLPLALAWRGDARRLRRDVASGQLRVVDPLPRLGHAQVTDTTVEHEGRPYVLARDGHLISARNVRVLSEPAPRPPQVPRGARWIHVKLSEQTLVAYEGARPVFATLVSSGKEGHETPTGLYRIHTKHVSTTMDGLAGTDDVYSIEDVPWTMYFHGSYALHAAFWHDRFGRVRSHGCVNLAPADARWLFGWTTPTLPPGWHGTRALKANPGTYVFIEP